VKSSLPIRTCLKCGKQFQPHRCDQKCCDSRCRRRLNHNEPLQSDFRVIHATPTQVEGYFAVTVRYGILVLTGFLFNQCSGWITWPSNVNAWGPFWQQEGRGLGSQSKILKRQINDWLADHLGHKPIEVVQSVPSEQQTTVSHSGDDDKQESPTAPVEVPKIRRVLRLFCPSCSGECDFIGGTDLKCRACSQKLRFEEAVRKWEIDGELQEVEPPKQVNTAPSKSAIDIVAALQT
jgi:hypothetical protein